MSSMIDVKVLGGIFLVLSISGLITVSLVYKLTGGKIPFQYGIMLDAGSTKTQVTLYKWEGQKDKGTGIVKQVDACKAKGGLHTSKDIFHVGKSIIPCLNNVSRSVPNDQQDKTPLYLGATAGMRMLRLENPYHADSIILGVKYTLLKNSKFLIKDVGIIEGRDEGIFAWVTGNFLLDTLHSEVNDATATFGALDMGGASTQISFEMPPRNVSNIDNATTVNMELYGQEHLVFAESYLCFGVNEAMRRHRAILTIGKSPNDLITDPCGFKDDEVEYDLEYLFDHQCTKSLAPTIVKKDIVYKFKGAGDNKECSAAVEKLTDQEECKKLFKEPCFSAPKEKISNVKYMAVSTFYFTASALNITNTTLKDYKKAIDDYCKLSKNVAESWLKPNEVEYVRDYCLEAHYVHHILTNEYGFNETTWENIMFIIMVDGSDLGWSLGYMINATNAIPKGKPAMPLISQSTLIILLVIFSLLTVAAILMLLLFPRHRHQSTITVLPK